ncbi:MAG: 16S rRNA (guanine(527)-N(7))-methyltransferase RsmG [Caldisericaceae bacterium]
MFEVYRNVLKDWNGTRINITAITEDKEIVLKHFIDSLELVRVVPPFSEGDKIVDIGTGGGFPGVPIKIAFPQISLTLLDSQKKRALFLGVLLGRLGLQDVAVFNARGEELAKDSQFREIFDIATMREFGKIPLNLEIGMPFVKVGGSLVLWKGKKDIDELQNYTGLINELGGRLEKIEPYTLYKGDTERYLVCISKEWNTPQKYPRAYSSILRSLRRK